MFLKFSKCHSWEKTNKPCTGAQKMCVCVDISEPLQRPCETKWLQWIKIERDLWINRGRLLVDRSDRQIDEPLPAEIGSWFALCIPSIPQSLGGKVPSQHVAYRRRQEEGGTHLLNQPPPPPLSVLFLLCPSEGIEQHNQQLRRTLNIFNV